MDGITCDDAILNSRELDTFSQGHPTFWIARHPRETKPLKRSHSAPLKCKGNRNCSPAGAHI